MYSVLRSLLLVVAIASACVAQSQQHNSSQQQQTAPCMEPEQKQLDFWVGEWELTWPENTFSKAGRGTNNVQRTLDGCVVQESFSDGESMPLRGLSVSTYDARAGKWKHISRPRLSSGSQDDRACRNTPRTNWGRCGSR